MKPKLKIFKISQNDVRGYDTFDSAIVVAKDELNAKYLIPRFTRSGGAAVICDQLPSTSHYGWTGDPDKVKVEYLGEVDENSPYNVNRCCIISSFNAG